MALLETVFQVGDALGYIAAVVVGFMYYFSKNVKDQRAEVSEAEKQLVTILKATVDELEKKVKKLQEEHMSNKEEIKKLRVENDVITKVLQGRDDKTEQMFEMIRETNEHVASLREVLEQNNKLLERFCGNITQHKA